MRRIPIICLLLFCFQSLLIGQTIHLIRIDGTINPVAAEYLRNSIRAAKNANATCLIIQLNTPGGLLQSTRVMVGDILDAPLPVIVYVSPYGAHAGSAGVFITMAGHIAAMAPGTNIGAAHPVSARQMDSVMNSKATNDAAAFIRTIAQYRNRDTAWAEEAVRNSVSITAKEAVEKHVIDLMATNIPDLLRQLEGRQVEVNGKPQVLHTSGAAVETIQMSWVQRLLNIIVDPNIAYILMMMGIYGIFFELYSPGTILPGVVGVISLILAFYAMQSLPVNYAGIALILFALVLFILEIKITSYGMLTLGGLIALTLGSLMLVQGDSAPEFMRISRNLILLTVSITTIFFGTLAWLGLRAQRNKVVTGAEAIIGSMGTAQDDFEQSGYIMVMGEIWQAESVSGPVQKGQQVRVTGRDKFLLKIEPLRSLI